MIQYRYRETFNQITVKREGEQYEQVIRLTVDGEVVNGAGADGTGRTQNMIPLQDDHRSITSRWPWGK